jgi:hypothetical protein
MQDYEDLYKDANAYFYFEDYEEALSHYLNVYENYPDNYNLDYRIGLCYLNVAGSKQKAIPYLERASRNISRRYNENSLRETLAPIDALFYLGNAYFTNNQLNKAKATYERFLSEIKSQKKYDMDYLNHQIEGLSRSKIIQTYPVNFLRSNLGETINNRFPNFNPVVSGDGKTLAYTTKERFYQAIYVCRKEGDNWGRPQNITLDLVVDGNCSTLSLSYNGDELYLFKDDDHVGNIWVTNFKEDRWTPMRKLNENINTQYYETHASVTADGKKLYFSSNRSGGYGDLDIYISEREKGGDWGQAVNLGPNINTDFNENTPFITTDGNTLFFSSEGHNNMGGYDIFFAQKQSDGSWSKPVNLGYPINSTDDDIFYHPLDDGSIGLMAVFDSKGFGETDISKIEIFLPKYQRSIVSSNDYFARRADLPSKTLVIDTVNVAGVALLDPSRPENAPYIDNEKRYTLFFEGKPYDIRDQSQLRKSISAKLVPRQTNEVKRITPRHSIALDSEQADSLAFMDSLLTNFTQKFDTLRTIKPIGEAEKLISDSLTQKPTDKELSYSKIPSAESERLTKILMQLADSDIKPIVAEAMLLNWEIPPAMLTMQAIQLSNHADSLGNTKEFITLYSKLLDVVSAKSVESKYRQSRLITQTSLDEDFFFRLQRLKRLASPGLAALLDEAILSQPQISSFLSLWEYLNTEKELQIKPYLNELLELLIKSSIEDYFALPQTDKEAILKSITEEEKPVKGIFVISITFVLGLFILIFLLRKRKRKSLNK